MGNEQTPVEKYVLPGFLGAISFAALSTLLPKKIINENSFVFIISIGAITGIILNKKMYKKKKAIINS
jgi:hypothetical protein